MLPFENVSTGRLPESAVVQRLIEEAHEDFRDEVEGNISQVYPALARVAPGLFGIAVAGVGCKVFAVGDADHEFSIMSVSKSFLFTLLCELVGWAEARQAWRQRHRLCLQFGCGH